MLSGCVLSGQDETKCAVGIVLSGENETKDMSSFLCAEGTLSGAQNTRNVTFQRFVCV